MILLQIGNSIFSAADVVAVEVKDKEVEVTLRTQDQPFVFTCKSNAGALETLESAAKAMGLVPLKNVP